ncbi:MAG: ribosome biogenesis/translation initiation ATPase RLI, partial [Halobacteriota archaeon]|nr:ribosome biogenesis/translation initiation ATPase RLI [Halobacteriota archaeon]
RYGPNAFVLYGLPIPTRGRVTGILGPNGTGKSTAINILSGIFKPNLGSEDTNWEDVIKHYAGSELQEYFRQVQKGGGIRISIKPQYIDFIPKKFEGRVSELLKRTDERGKLDELIARFKIESIIERELIDLSGGELQRVAIVACMAKDADFYFFDEITPYLDVFQRINVAKLIRELAESKTVMVVEHDLAILDLLADVIHITYGKPGVYGVMTQPKGVRVGINEYLKGYLREENIRIRPEAIEFELHAPRPPAELASLAKYSAFSKGYNGFTLEVKGGRIRKGEVVGIVGQNGIGKSTFVKVFAGEIEPSSGEVDLDIKISYKPQYLKAQDLTVRELLRSLTEDIGLSYYINEILRPLQLEGLLDSNTMNLSGGELQRVAIAACLSRDADMYILDEPSAHLDVEQRAQATKALRRFAKNNDVSAMVVDHDIYMIDLLSDGLIVFSGEPTVHGEVFGPFEMRDGMNRFLKGLSITFRRDETKRPRINKPDSKLDREQKTNGEYYYVSK